MRARASSRFLDSRALAALQHMRFTTRQRIEGSFSGRHQSRQRGGAGEFIDFREYSGGEDLRRLDWKVYARTGKAFVRLHQDETNLCCMLAVDTSGSMAFEGNRDAAMAKLGYVQYLATALSHVISQGQDQVGLALLADELVEFIPPGAMPSHILRVQQQIERLMTRPATQMAPALHQLFQQVARRGVLLLMSDYLMDDLDELFSALRMFRHRGWEVIVLHVVHPDEEHLPDGIAYRFEGMENDGALACSPQEIRASYEEQFRTHLAMVRQLAMAAGCDYRLASTAVSYLKTLQGFLVERVG